MGSSSCCTLVPIQQQSLLPTDFHPHHLALLLLSWSLLYPRAIDSKMGRSLLIHLCQPLFVDLH